MLTVMKFGGSSLATAEKVENAAGIIVKKAREGSDIVCVVSAQGKTTDELVKRAEEVAKAPSPRENDVLLSSGEQISMSLLAMKLCDMGYDSISLLGWQAGIHTDGRHGNASIKSVQTERIKRELGKGRIVIVAGFQGISSDDDITTLGRGGSDTTAIALAAALGADECCIYTDVKGVYSANPKVAPDAVKHDEMTYDEMLEMSTLGAKVMHNRSVSMAKKSRVGFEVCSSFDGERGTFIHDFAPEKTVSGIVCDGNIAMLTVEGIERGENTCRLFRLLAENGISVDVIIRSQLYDGGKGTVSFSVSETILPQVRALLEAHRGEIGYTKLSAETGLAKLSAVGSGLADSCLVASYMLSEMNKLGIDPKYITTGEIRISVIIPREMSISAERALNSAFFGEGRRL